MFGTRRIQIVDLPLKLQAVISRSRILSLLTGSIWFGVNEIDRDLFNLMKLKNGFFVELGGNDGLNQSNSKHLELFRGWRGVLIEPFPENFRRMVRNRSPKSLFVNAACVSFAFPDSEMLLTYSNLMTTPLQGESDIKNRIQHAKMGSDFLPASDVVHTFKAPAITLTQVLDNSKAPQLIDLLSLDVEGGELEVLKGVDHKKYQFRWMVVESRSPEALNEYLEKEGYTKVCQLSVHDYVYRFTN
jgi:FkbM family methyltransferase